MQKTDLLKALSDSTVSEFVDHVKLLKSEVFAELAQDAIDHFVRHGDYTKVQLCLHVAKDTEYFRSCLKYFEENSSLSFSIGTGVFEISIDRGKRPVGKALASYLASDRGSFESVVEDVSKKSDCLNDRQKSRKTEVRMSVLGKERRTIKDMAAVLEKTPSEYRNAVYRDLARQQQDAKDEQKSAKFLSGKEELGRLRRLLPGANGQDRVALLEKISKMEKAVKRLAPKRKNAWSPVLPGSFGSKR